MKLFVYSLYLKKISWRSQQRLMKMTLNWSSRPPPPPTPLGLMYSHHDKPVEALSQFSHFVIWWADWLSLFNHLMLRLFQYVSYVFLAIWWDKWFNLFYILHYSPALFCLSPPPPTRWQYLTQSLFVPLPETLTNQLKSFVLVCSNMSHIVFYISDNQLRGDVER